MGPKKSGDPTFLSVLFFSAIYTIEPAIFPFPGSFFYPTFDVLKTIKKENNGKLSENEMEHRPGTQ
jgi:hypothetical protein